MANPNYIGAAGAWKRTKGHRLGTTVVVAARPSVGKTAAAAQAAKANQKLSKGRGKKGWQNSANLKSTDTLKEVAKAVAKGAAKKVRIIMRTLNLPTP